MHSRNMLERELARLSGWCVVAREEGGREESGVWKYCTAMVPFVETPEDER